MTKLTEKADVQMDERTDPNYRKASPLKLPICTSIVINTYQSKYFFTWAKRESIAEDSLFSNTAPFVDLDI